MDANSRSHKHPLRFEFLKYFFLRWWIVSFAIIASPQAAGDNELPDYVIERFGHPPEIPKKDPGDNLKRAVDTAFIDSIRSADWGRDQQIALKEVVESGDPRLAWLIADLMRFISDRQFSAQLGEAAATLLGREIDGSNDWGVTTDHLIAWNIPAPPDYLRIKRAIFTTLVPAWGNLFVEGDIDWRMVSWGGVFMDQRAYDTTDEPCNCIPAADNPEVAQADDAKWLKDSDIIFGVEVNGEYRAYPRRIMEVREMVNDTLGGRHLGIPYCTLCGSAQAYFTDNLPSGVERPVLRTSGLLIRSNKVMYDITSQSVLDTFTGRAVTGPLAQRGITLDQASVVTSDWGSWKKAHPKTTVLKESLALGRDFDFRNNRDANGPIFPIGAVDPRLPVHEDIIGVKTSSGQPIAFQRSKALFALKNGEVIEHDNVKLVLDGGGIKAVDKNGKSVSSHQAFWFAWSQFHPETVLWPQ